MIKLRLFLYSLAVLPFLPAIGCTENTLLLPEFREDVGAFVIERPVRDGIVQTLLLSHAEVATGDTLQILSMVSNRGSTPVTMTISDCGLFLDTRLDHVSVRDCFLDVIPGVTLTLQPGDSKAQRKTIRVRSGPGIYRVRVKHVLEPEFWLAFDLRVRG